MYKLINYITESEVKELTHKDKKILTLIHNKVWLKHTEDEKIRYDVVEELKNLDENIVLSIYEFLHGTMGFENVDVIEYFLKLFINNFQEDGDYNKLTTQKPNIIPNPNNHHRAVANNSDIPPLLVIDMKDYLNYGMPGFYDMVNDIHYAVGNEKETLEAIREQMQDRYYNFYETTQFESGVHTLVNYLFIGDTDKRIIASEYAESVESDNGIDKIIRMIKDYDYEDEDKKLMRRYYQLEHNEDDPINSGIPKKVEMDQIEDSLRERLRELVYDDEYYKMDNYIVDWLMDHGYLTQDQKYGDYEFTKPYLTKYDEVDVSKLPKWLNFDREEFIDDMATIDRAGELSNIDHYYETETIDDDTYYIIEIDY